MLLTILNSFLLAQNIIRSKPNCESFQLNSVPNLDNYRKDQKEKTSVLRRILNDRDQLTIMPCCYG